MKFKVGDCVEVTWDDSTTYKGNLIKKESLTIWRIRFFNVGPSKRKYGGYDEFRFRLIK